ncbi:MAG: hypothetical protein OXC80_02615 [Gammaproteobacteria bacterium]|nr:hypothetical protein [Gammaproteobacteria bacterium]
MPRISSRLPLTFDTTEDRVRVSSVVRKVLYVFSVLTISVGLHANIRTEILPIIHWSEYEQTIFANISQATNLVAYINHGMGSQNASITLREIGTGEIRCRWDSQGRPFYIEFSPDGTKLLVLTPTIRSRDRLWRNLNLGVKGSYIPYVYDTSSCLPLSSLVLKKGNYGGLRFSDDGLYVLGVRWSRDYSSQSTLFKVRIDGTEPMQEYHPVPTGISVYYKLREKDAFLVSREAGKRADNPGSARIVSVYESGNTTKRSLLSRLFGRESRRENTLLLSKDGPLTTRGFSLSRDQSRFVFLWPIAHPLEEPTDVYSVIYDTNSLEETHRWVFYKDSTTYVGHPNRVTFFPQSSDLVLSWTSSGTVMIHRLQPNLAQLLLQFDTNIEEGTFDFSHEGSMFVVSGKVPGSPKEHSILIYRTADLGIEMQTTELTSHALDAN